MSIILPLNNLNPYLSEVPNVPPLEIIPFETPNTLVGLIQASIVKLPVISSEAEFGTET